MPTTRRRSRQLKIIVTGLIAQHPTLGGITWHYLQYVLGLDRLNHDVYYFEDSGEGPYNTDGGPTGRDWVSKDCSRNVAHLATTASRFGFENRWAYHCPIESSWYGLTDEKREAVLSEADLLINTSGTLSDPSRYRGISRLAYIDTDPVVTHAKIAGRRDFRGRVDAHDIHFTFGESMNDRVPETGHSWHATRQPIVLSEWEPVPSRRDAYTTVMNWASYEPLVYREVSYGQKDVEFRQFLHLPASVTPVYLEVALGGTRHRQWESADLETDMDPVRLLEGAGWGVVDADAVCGDALRYRDFIRSSRAEWSVAKNAYVRGQPGWFSERSACYLAAARPVIVQDTGFTGVLPTGKGILPFADLDGAVEAIAAVEGDYENHCEAARSIAESHFDSDKVLSKLVADAMDSA